jgi:hypothetical protein
MAFNIGAAFQFNLDQAALTATSHEDEPACLHS